MTIASLGTKEDKANDVGVQLDGGVWVTKGRWITVFFVPSSCRKDAGDMLLVDIITAVVVDVADDTGEVRAVVVST